MKKGKDYIGTSLKGRNIHVQVNDEKEKYSKQQFVEIYKGYDFLEDIYVVRAYIQKRYKIDFRELQILLKLMGMRVFSREDYSSLPKQFTFNKFKSIIESGYINLLSDHYDVEKRLYTLNTKGRNIVIKFYKYLSGEEKIPETSDNPMANRKTQIAFDKKKMDLIRKMNQAPIKEHNKTLFT